MQAARLVSQIEQWPVYRLIPYARNPRTHSDNQIAQIAGSIAEFGFTNPILVDSKDGIIAGTDACKYSKFGSGVACQ